MVKIKNNTSHSPENFADFVGTTVHEINNFLSAINGFSELVMMDMNEDDPHYHYLQEVLNAVDNIQVFSQQLLALVARIPLSKEVIAAAVLLKLFSDFSGADPSLFSEVEIDENITIFMDEKWTERALKELREFSRLCGNDVRIFLKNDSDYLLFQWEINLEKQSPDITKIDISKLFEPYYSSRNLFSTKGLGLSWLPGFFHRQQGDISAFINEHNRLEFRISFAKTDKSPPSTQ